MLMLTRQSLLAPFVKSRAAASIRAMAYTYQYPRPAVTVDAVIVSRPQPSNPPQLLLVKRKFEPCKDQWALPGGFVNEGESLEVAAARELQEETSVNPDSVQLVQVGAYGAPGRDPRGWTITVAFAALVPDTHLGVKAADDAAEAEWFGIGELPTPLAFDHQLVIRDAFRTLAGKLAAASGEGALLEMLETAAIKLKGP